MTNFIFIETFLNKICLSRFMNNKLYILIIGFFIISFLISSVYALDVVFFYGQGCPHCAKMHPFLNEMKDKYNITLDEYEVYYNKDNQMLFYKMSSAYGMQPQGVPTVFIGDKVFVGESEQIKSNIESKIKECLNSNCVSPFDVMNGKVNLSSKNSKSNENGFPREIVYAIFVIVIIGIIIAVYKIKPKKSKK